MRAFAYQTFIAQRTQPQAKAMDSHACPRPAFVQDPSPWRIWAGGHWNHCCGAMAAPSGDDVTVQLAALLGRGVRDVVRIRKTPESPPWASVFDAIQALTQTRYAKDVWRDIVLQYPEVESCTRHFKFPGQGQRNTPVTDARGIVEISVSRERRARILQISCACANLRSQRWRSQCSFLAHRRPVSAVRLLIS